MSLIMSLDSEVEKKLKQWAAVKDISERVHKNSQSLMRELIGFNFQWRDPKYEVAIKRAIREALEVNQQFDLTEESNCRREKTDLEIIFGEQRCRIRRRVNRFYARLLKEVYEPAAIVEDLDAGFDDSVPEVETVEANVPAPVAEGASGETIRQYPSAAELEEVFGRSDDEGESSEASGSSLVVLPRSTGALGALVRYPDSDEENVSAVVETPLRASKRVVKAVQCIGDYNRPTKRAAQKKLSPVCWEMTVGVPLGLVRIEFNHKELIFQNPLTGKLVKLPVPRSGKEPPRQVYDLTDLGGEEPGSTGML